MADRERLLFATSNPGKVREIRQILAGLPLDLLFLPDVGNPPEVEETGTTFEENARLKARGYAPYLKGGYVAAEDSGIVVPALQGEPGVHSARYGGLRGDEERNRLLLHRMRELRGEERRAFYQAVVVLLEPDGEEKVFTGRVDGRIAEAPSGQGGFGYDPLFFHPPSGTTFGRLSPKEKDRYSHRGLAVRALKRYLEGVLGGFTP